MCSHTEPQGNTNTVDKVTAILDGSTHSEFKSFGETIQMIFLGKQNTTLYSIYHHEGGVGVLRAALQAAEPREQVPSIHVSKQKAPYGPLQSRKKERKLKKKKSVCLGSKQPCNPTSIIKVITTDIKENTVIYTCEYLSGVTK